MIFSGHDEDIEWILTKLSDTEYLAEIDASYNGDISVALIEAYRAAASIGNDGHALFAGEHLQEDDSNDEETTSSDEQSAEESASATE